jgi:hypothetical protein
VLSQLSYSPTCAQESILTDFPLDCQCQTNPKSDPGRRCASGTPPSAAPPRRGTPFVARRAVNLHGCALPHCAPLLRRLRRTLPLRAPQVVRCGVPRGAHFVRERGAPSVLSSRYVAVFMTGSASFCGRRGESFRNDKVFLRAADQCIEQVPGFRRKHAPYPVATEKNNCRGEKDRRRQRGEEITPSDGFPSASPSRPVARVCARSRSGQGLAPRTLAKEYDFLLTERAFFRYSKPSPRD